MAMPGEDDGRPFWQTALHFAILVGILIFATWGAPKDDTGFWAWIYDSKWIITSLFGVLLGVSLVYILKIKKLHVLLAAIPVIVLALLFPGEPLIPFSAAVLVVGTLISLTPGEPNEWMGETWGFTKQILPLLGAGVLIAGFLLGTPGNADSGIIPGEWIASLVGGNSLASNFFASIVGAFMYFATLTEVPILQGLISNGMGKGPALALLLAGPALSLPNMLVIRSVIGNQKTAVYLVLVVIMATLSGLIYGTLF
jgi:hypothetical protein